MNEPYKARAERLGAFLTLRHGVKLKHTSLLEAIAAEEGARNWHTLRTRADEQPEGILGGLPGAFSSSMPVSFATFEDCRVWLLERMHASELEYLQLLRVQNEWRISCRLNSGEYQSGPLLTEEQAHQAVAHLLGLARLATELDKPKYGQFISTLERQGVLSEVPFVLCTIPTLAGPCLILRAHRPSRLLSAQDLQLSAGSGWLNAVVDGPLLNVVVGPTGSGKTSTLRMTARTVTDANRAACLVSECASEMAGVLSWNCSVLSSTGAGKNLAKALKAALTLGVEHVIVDHPPFDKEAAAGIRALVEKGTRVSFSLHAGDVHGAVLCLERFGLNPRSLDSSVGVLCQTAVQKKKAGSAKSQVFASHFCEVTPAVECAIADLPTPSTAADAASLLEQGLIDYESFVHTYGHAGLRSLPAHLRKPL